MEEGLWTVVFRAGQVSAGGVVVLRSGNLMGGDSQFYYTGNYSVQDSKITATIRVQAFVGNAVTVFGAPVANFDLNLSGTLTGNQASAVATSNAFPSLRMQMNMVKRV